jgi:GTP-binding protein EngB required for normal cell division
MSCLIHPSNANAILSRDRVGTERVSASYFAACQQREPMQFDNLDDLLWDSATSVASDFATRVVAQRDLLLVAWRSVEGVLVGAQLRAGFNAVESNWTCDAESVLFRQKPGNNALAERAVCLLPERAYCWRTQSNELRIEFGSSDLSIDLISRRFSIDAAASVFPFAHESGFGGTGMFSRIVIARTSSAPTQPTTGIISLASSLAEFVAALTASAPPPRLSLNGWRGGSKGVGRLVVVGNPGCGKSTLLNVIAGECLFVSGVSDDARGLTRAVAQRASASGALLVDTPGFDDIGGRVQSAVEMARALGCVDAQHDRCIVVVELERGRVRQSDVDLMRILLAAMGDGFKYALVFNKVSATLLAQLMSAGVAAPQVTLLVPPNKTQPSAVFAYPMMDELRSASNASAAPAFGFFAWLDSLPAHGGGAACAHMDTRNVHDLTREHAAKVELLRVEIEKLKK